MKYNRQKEMIAYIREKRAVRNEELLNMFNISIQTLRRDLDSFEKQGLIEKVYGGTVYNPKADSIASTGTLSDRDNFNAVEKEYVAKLAAAQVEEDDVIFVDSGSTCYRIVHYLEHLKKVTVISHSLDVMNAIRGMANITGICVGGVLQHDSGSFLNDSNYYPFSYNKAFIATVGISTTRSLTNTNIYEAGMKARVIDQSSIVYIVADHSKFDVVAYNHFADYSKVNAIITDRQPSEYFEHFFADQGVRLIY